MDTWILAARVGLSLAAVLGLLWWLNRRMAGSAVLKRRRREGLIVLGRQQLGGKSGVALIEVSGRKLVVGYGEQGVSLIHDAGIDADAEAGPSALAPDITASPEATAVHGELDAPAAPASSDLEPALEADAVSASLRLREPAPVHVRTISARTAEVRRHRTSLEGSILAPDTWRKAVVAAQDWTTRRS